jgi:hypothetical protein
MERRMTALLSLRPLGGDVCVTVERSAGDHYLTVDQTTLVVTLWHESSDVVRGRFDHPSSGSVAYFQTSAVLFALADALRLRVVR